MKTSPVSLIRIRSPLLNKSINRLYILNADIPAPLSI
jgi:hypothetical protein